MEKAFLEFLEQEESLYNHHLSLLDSIKNNHTFNIGDLRPYRSMFNKLATVNVKTTPYRTAFIICQVSRMVMTFLRDLQQLLREYVFDHKEEVLKEIERLIQKTKNIMDTYYETYGSLPYNRFYESWYYTDRLKYLPYHPYEEYYSNMYPEKKFEGKLGDLILQDLTSKRVDYYDSRQFVPCSFGGTQGEYDAWLALQAYKKLKKKEIYPLEDDQNLPMSERLLNKIRGR